MDNMDAVRPVRATRDFIWLLRWIPAALLLALAIRVEADLAPRTREETLARGANFLIRLFDPELNLLPEFRGSKTYWLFHDNYLAARMLARVQPELSGKIYSALVKFSVTNSGKIEIVFDEARQPLPFRTYQLINVALIDGKRIR